MLKQNKRIVMGCKCCSATCSMVVNEVSIIDNNNGVPVEVAFNYLSKEEQEWMKTKKCPNCR